MRKFVALALVLGLAVPAMADLATGLKTNPTLATGMQHTGEGTVGVFAPPSAIYLDFKTVAEVSDMLTVTFAFHWPFTTSVWATQVQSSLVWDNSEVAITSVTGPDTGPWAGGYGTYNIYPSAYYGGPTTAGFPGWVTWTALDATSGTVQAGSVLGAGYPLWLNPVFASSTQTSLGYVHLANTQALVEGSGYYPFMKVQMHVKDVIADSYLDLVIGSFAVLFWTTPSAAGSTLWTGGTIAASVGYGGSYGLGIIPEPASLSLLGMGLVAVGAGVWRRRR
jgi:hypothetical protein